MALYRKKPVIIEAHQLTPDSAPFWRRQAHTVVLEVGDERRDKPSEPGEMYVWVNDEGRVLVAEIFTLEGMHRADLYDWIITGVKGERYPCKPDVFDATYEPAGEEAFAAGVTAGKVG